MDHGVPQGGLFDSPVDAAHMPRQLGVPSEWAAAVRVDVNGMDPSKMTALMRSPDRDGARPPVCGVLSLDTFRDSPKREGVTLLDSPHSEMIAAEQRRRPHRPLTEADLTEMHHEKRRRQKLKVLREERRALIESDA
eukprot:gene36056-29046_t